MEKTRSIRIWFLAALAVVGGTLLTGVSGILMAYNVIDDRSGILLSAGGMSLFQAGHALVLRLITSAMGVQDGSDRDTQERP